MLGAAYSSQIYNIPQGTLQPTVPPSVAVKSADDEEKLDAERRERLLAAYNKELEQTLALHPVEEAPQRKVKSSKPSAPRSGLDVSRYPPPNTRTREAPSRKRGMYPYKQPPLRDSVPRAAQVAPQADAPARPTHTRTAVGAPTHRSRPPVSLLRPEVPAAQPADKAVAVTVAEGSVVSRPDTPTAAASALASQLVDMPLEPLYSLAQAQANAVELGILDKVQRLEALVLVQQQQLGLHRDMVRELRQRMHAFVQRSRTAHAGRLATTTRVADTRMRRPTAAPRPGPGFSGYTRSYATAGKGTGDGQVAAAEPREARLTSMIDRLYRRPAQVTTGVGHGPTEEEREREREQKERQERERKERIAMQRARAQEDRLRERREREVRQAQEQAARDAQRERERLQRERAKDQERQRRDRARERAKEPGARVSNPARSDRQRQPAAPRPRPVAPDVPVAAAIPAPATAPATAPALVPAPVSVAASPLPKQRAPTPPPPRSFPELDDVDDSLLVPGSARVYGKRAATPTHTSTRPTPTTPTPIVAPTLAHTHPATPAPAPAPVAAPECALTPVSAPVAAHPPSPSPAPAESVAVTVAAEPAAPAPAPAPTPATPAIAAPAAVLATADADADADAFADYADDFSDDFEDVDVADAPTAQVAATAVGLAAAPPEAQLLTLSLSARHLPPRHAHADVDAAVNDPLPDALLAVYALAPTPDAKAEATLWALPAAALLHVAEGTRGSTSPTFADVLALTLQPSAEAGAEHVRVSVSAQRVVDQYPAAATLPLQRASVSLTPAHLLRFEVHHAALFTPAAVPSAASLLALAVLPLHTLLARTQKPQALLLTPAHASAASPPLLLLHPPAERPHTQRLPAPLNAPPTRPVFDALPMPRVSHVPAAMPPTPAREHNAAVFAVTSLPPPSLAGLSADFGEQVPHASDALPAVPAATGPPPHASPQVGAGPGVFDTDMVYDDFDFEEELEDTAQFAMAADPSPEQAPHASDPPPASNALFAPIGVEDDYDFDFDL